MGRWEDEKMWGKEAQRRKKSVTVHTICSVWNQSHFTQINRSQPRNRQEVFLSSSTTGLAVKRADARSL